MISRLVDEYVRMFLRKYAPQRLPPKRSRIVAVRPSLGLEKGKRTVAPLNSNSVTDAAHAASEDTGNRLSFPRVLPSAPLAASL
jgi:hypothetical protein